MNSLLVLLAVVAVASALPTRVKRGHIEEHGHGHATSYQNFNLESYHPVPVYKKHEHVVHKASYEHLSSDDGDLGGHAALSLGEHDEGYGLGEGSYHRSSLTDGTDHGDDGYAHLGAAAVSEDAEEGYEGHGSY
ncbi:uncharacterized protein LOC117641321 [Thrips palmi]|uniref:Uncharacterized protein LOC117641321 n=1 Tax=Thrips palmi TaxID=161013 RepID=A0A6P8YDG7_THRPL|nr:uncharacterized protein LOC117641321 [Thrips palmi]